MNARMIFPLGLLICFGFTSAPAVSSKIVGDYVEARTASVFAGACHYNGELVTTGDDAVMAWSIQAGTWKGTNLAGVKAMAAVTCDANLSVEGAARKSEVVVDSSASSAQVAAFVDLLHAQCGAQVGDVVSVRQERVKFNHSGTVYTVNADGFAKLAVQAMPNNECCSQPSLVWYSPLVKLDHRKVGYTKTAAYSSGRIGDTWERAGENSAFYGEFTF